jgi:hypothetical protein
MTETLRNATLATQIVATAYFILVVGGAMLAMLSSVVGRLTGKKTKLDNPIAVLVGIGVLVGIPAAFGAAAALFITPLLVGMPLPLAGWLMIAAFALWGFWGAEASGGEMGGCSRMIGISLSAYGLTWALTAVVLADPPAGNAASFLRPLLVATPLAVFLGKGARGDKVKQTIGFGLMMAMLCAVAFLPVERGFAAILLPVTDWLRFPIAGAIAFGIWPLLTVPISLLVGDRRIMWREKAQGASALGLVGAAFGLVWALTRLVF